MEAKKCLQSYYHYAALIRIKEERLRRLRDLQTSTVASLSGIRVKSTTEHSRIEYCAAEIDEIERELYREKRKCRQCKRRVEALIHAVKDDDLRLLLKLRHLNGLTWKDCARVMNYSESYVRNKLYEQALLPISSILTTRAMTKNEK